MRRWECRPRDQIWCWDQEVAGQGQPRSRSCSCCSTGGPPVFHQRLQEQETTTVATGTAQHSMQNARGRRGHKQQFASFTSSGASLLWGPSHRGTSHQSSGWDKAVQGWLCVFSVLLCKVPPAEHAHDPGSVKGSIPRCLNWRTRRTPAAGSPPALRGARDCNQVGSVENQLGSFLSKWRHSSCPLSKLSGA